MSDMDSTGIHSMLNLFLWLEVVSIRLAVLTSSSHELGFALIPSFVGLFLFLFIQQTKKKNLF